MNGVERFIMVKYRLGTLTLGLFSLNLAAHLAFLKG